MNETTHAILPDGSRVVREIVSGRWYQTWPPAQRKPRRALRIRDAVDLACRRGAVVFIGVYPGGEAFDRAYTRTRPEGHSQ